MKSTQITLGHPGAGLMPTCHLKSSVMPPIVYASHHYHRLEILYICVCFFQTFDQLFDIMNSRSPFGQGHKHPLRLANLRYVEEIFQKARAHILSLSMSDGTPVWKSPR